MASRILLLVLYTAAKVPENQKYLGLEEFSRTFNLETRVFNAFPNSNVTAFVLFEQDRISRLHYGDLAVLNATLEPNSNFIIKFRQAPMDTVINTYTDFGFMDAELGNSVDVLLLIRRDSDNPRKPKHHLITSNGNNVERDSSKLFIYNAVWNRAQNEDPGLSFYGLFLRANFDGSESESITQLAVNVGRNEGKEMNLDPSTPMEIKGFYRHIRSVSEFKLTPSVVSLKSYRAVPGLRKYLVAYGDYTGDVSNMDVAPPQLKLLERKISISAAPEPTACGSVLVTISITSVFVLMYM